MTDLFWMVTRTQFAELALAMPDAVQGSHFGQPDFRVRGKIFAGLDRSAERASLKVRKELQAVLVAGRPEAFVPAAGAWGEHGWTYAELPRVDLDELRELVADAWRQIAPARLVAAHADLDADLPELEIEPIAPARTSPGKKPAKKSPRSAATPPREARLRKKLKKKRSG